MQQIYKIIVLCLILLMINFLKPSSFNIKTIINNILSKKQIMNNYTLINVVCNYVNSLNNSNFDYQNIIEQKIYMKPKKNNKFITKIINNFINKTFIIKNIYISNVLLLEEIKYYEINNGIYVPNIKFQIDMISDLISDSSYRFIISMDLYIISNTNIVILGIKTDDIITMNENKQNDFNSIFIKMPEVNNNILEGHINNNMLDVYNKNYSEDSLIPTIDDI